MNKPKVSIVIPAHNEEAKIAECLVSIQKYAAKAFEVIVVDNASADNTSTITESFGFVKMVSEPRKGVMFAREKGWRESNGEIVAFIDADCRVVAGWIEQIESEFDKDKNLAVLSGPYVYYDIPLWQRALCEMYFIFAMGIYCIVGYMAIFGNLAIRRSVLEKMSGLDTSIEFYGDDTDTARRASRYGRVKFRYRFRIESSGRRICSQGLLSIAHIYSKNFFSEALFHKPSTKSSKDFR